MRVHMQRGPYAGRVVDMSTRQAAAAIESGEARSAAELSADEISAAESKAAAPPAGAPARGSRKR